jgi:hypothetical protein
MATKAKEITTKISIEQLKSVIHEAVEEQFQEYFGDPDEGLHVREEVIEQLKAQRKARKPRIPMEQVAKKYGFKLE